MNERSERINRAAQHRLITAPNETSRRNVRSQRGAGMSADTVQARNVRPHPGLLPGVPGVDTVHPPRFIGVARRPRPVPVFPHTDGVAPDQLAAQRLAALAVDLAAACRAAVDVDEVAALLEASGVNDRIAQQVYAQPGVFALADALLRQVPRVAQEPAPPTAPPLRPRVITTLVRAALYLTPAVLAAGASSQLSRLPVLAGPGALIAGWAGAQGLSYLGYVRLNTAGPAGAARLLLAGFGALAAVWGAVLWWIGVPWPAGYVVAGAQLALFAAVTAALVTGKELRALGGAALCWTAAGFGAGRWLLAALGVLLVVAYLPAWSRRSGIGRVGIRPVFAALEHGVIGGGQAVLCYAIVLAGAAGQVPLAAVPVMVAVPLIELTLLWHQHRITIALSVIEDPMVFRYRAARVGAGTLAVLALPVVAGPAVAGLAPPRLVAAVLLAGVFALTLVLVAHRRPGPAMALVGVPAALVALPPAPMSTAIAVLIAANLVGLPLAYRAMCDPASYR
jgi:hypothetical protein